MIKKLKCVCLMCFMLLPLMSFSTENILVVEQPKNSKIKQKVVTFFSDLQSEKTKSGKFLEDRRNVTITFLDPKEASKGITEFDDMPKGYLNIKYEGLNDVYNELIYIGQNKGGSEIYALTYTTLGFDILYLMKGDYKLNNKTYNTLILIGQSNSANYGGLPLYYVGYYCNVK